jgi:hypothetical protein
LGNDWDEVKETSLILSEEEKMKHFDWCWNKTIENFNKENIKFNSKGEHREYFQQFFIDLFYHAEKKEIALNIEKFFLEILSNKTTFTKSDLDMITDIYKRLNKNLK